MNTRVNTPQAYGYTPRQQQASYNTGIAEAHQQSDQRYNTKPLDRAGTSRGAGQNYMAGISASKNLVDGIASAHSQSMDDQAKNAAIDLGNTQAQESAGLEYGAIAQQNNYANALAALQRQQNMSSGNALGGLLGGGLTQFLGY